MFPQAPKKARHRAETGRRTAIRLPRKSTTSNAVKATLALALIGVATPGMAAENNSRVSGEFDFTASANTSVLESINKEIDIQTDHASLKTPSAVKVDAGYELKIERAKIKSIAPPPPPTPEEKRSTSLIASGVTANASGPIKAQPVKISKWVSPVPGAGITSEFGHRGAIPAAGVSAGLHNGIDLGARMGTPIHAAFDGEVVHVGFTDFDTHTGGIVVLLHKTADGEYLTSYNHMKSSGINVKVGDIVSSGETIAHVASEGRSSGPHLHFSVREVTGPNPLEDWKIMNPGDFLASNGVHVR